MHLKSEKPLRSDLDELRHMILGMRAAYAKGNNVMEYARQMTNSVGNLVVATLIAYDLQAGSYIAEVHANPLWSHAGVLSWLKF